MQGSSGGGEIAREGKQMKAPPRGRMLFPQHTDLAYRLGLGISDPSNKQFDNRVYNEWSIEPLTNLVLKGSKIVTCMILQSMCADSKRAGACSEQAEFAQTHGFDLGREWGLAQSHRLCFLVESWHPAPCAGVGDAW